MPSEIRFYRAVEPWGFLSNLWPAEITFEMRRYRCSEFAYQAEKFLDDATREWALKAPTASLCAQLAHSLLPWQVVPGWSDLKVPRMRRVLCAKFEQHPDLALRLAKTGDARLIEESKTDAFWGTGKKGTGKNMLGKLLEEVRAAILAGERPEDLGDLKR